MHSKNANEIKLGENVIFIYVTNLCRHKILLYFSLVCESISVYCFHQPLCGGKWSVTVSRERKRTMNWLHITNQWTVALAAAGIVSVGSVALAEEAAQHQVMTDLSSTTLSGYVDTSAIWKFGTGNQYMSGRSLASCLLVGGTADSLASTPSPVLINEVLANNVTFIENDGSTPDWIETAQQLRHLHKSFRHGLKHQPIDSPSMVVSGRQFHWSQWLSQKYILTIKRFPPLATQVSP